MFCEVDGIYIFLGFKLMWTHHKVTECTELLSFF